KGLLAAVAAATLLVGGAGTLAYWTADQTVAAGSLTSGSISLGEVDCDGGWRHSSDNAIVTELVPGDSITQVYAVDLTLVGDNIGATLTVADISAEGPLASALTFSEVTLAGTGVVDNEVVGAGTYSVTASVTADFPYGTAPDNSTQGITAEDLGDLELVA